MIPSRDLNALFDADSAEEIWAMHIGHMAAYGFDRLVYGFTHNLTETSMGDPADFVVFSNHDKAYLKRFLGDGLYLHAPMVRWSLRNDGAQSWSLVREMADAGLLTEKEHEVIAFNRSMNTVAGYSISFKSLSARSKGAIALTARAGLAQPEVDEIWRQHGEDILLLNNIVHLRLMSLPYNGAASTLTPRQREVLEWVSDGKTVQDIALLMGLTPGTVEKHLRLARAALNVETTAQAVLKAAFQNQIYVVRR